MEKQDRNRGHGPGTNPAENLGRHPEMESGTVPSGKVDPGTPPANEPAFDPAGEPIITKVEAVKRQPGRYRIEVNGEEAFTVHEDVLVKFRLIKGAVLTDALQRDVLAEEEQHAAYRHAVRYLGRAMRSSKQIRDKLQEKGYAPGLIRQVIQQLTDQGYVDDAAYAAALARQRLNQNRKGRLWIRHELAQSGIDKEQAERVLQEIDPDDEREQAMQLARKRWPSIKGDGRTRRHKLYAYLMRRGYPADTARSVVRRMPVGDGDDDGTGFEEAD